MRYLPCFPVALILLTAVGCGKPEFKEFKSSDGGFSVLMPGNPEKKEIPVMDLKTTAYGVNVRNGAYAVGYMDVPPGRPISLDGAIKGISTQHQGTVQTTKDFTLGGSTGKEFEVQTKQPQGYASGRVIVVGNRFYQVLAMGTNARLSDPDVRKFLDSFKLVK
jgi:hypothetical protein